MAGYVDAIGFLSADRYFVSFMSGNTTRLATELVVAPARAAIPALLIAGFVTGVASGGLVAHCAGQWRKPAVLGLVSLLLGVASTLALLNRHGWMMMVLVIAMGALNMGLHKDNSPIALTYLTGALVRIGQWIADRLARKAGPSAAPYLLLWLSLSGGAVTGALVFAREGSPGIVFAFLASLLLTLGGAWITRRS